MYSYKQIWQISLPIILGLLAQNIINVTDTAFLGHVSEVALGASGIGGLLYICVFTVAFGFSVGSQILIARRNGEGEYKSIGPIVLQGVLFLLLLACVAFVLIYLLGPHLVRVIVSSDAIFDATMEFLEWRVFGFFFIFIGAIFRAFFIGITRTRVITYNAIVMAVVNVALDYVLIFGKFGFPEMGIKGAAIASVIAEAMSLAFYLIYTYAAVDFKKYALNKLERIDFGLLKRVLSISCFTMIQAFLSMSTFFVFFIVIERLGERQLAVANIVRSIYVLLYIPLNAFSTTANSLVSNTIGSGNIAYVGALIKKISGFSLGVMIALSGLIAIFARPVLSVYTGDHTLVDDSVLSLYVVCVAMVIASVSNILFSSISGTGNTQAGLYVELGVLMIYGIYIFIAGVCLKLPVEICFMTEIIYYSFLLLASYIYLKRAKWQNKRI